MNAIAINTLHLGDCFDRDTGLGAADPVHHIITDIPFTSHVHANVRTNRRGAHNYIRAVQFKPFTPDDLWRFMNMCTSVLRRWLVVKCALEQLGVLHELGRAAGLRSIRSGTWTKTNPMPQQSGDRPGQGAEGLFIAHANVKPLRWNWHGRALELRGPTVRKAIHETESPLWLFESLVQAFTDPGDIVADPFAGRGTGLVAAKRNGRQFVGWEIDEGHHGAAVERLARTNEQLPIVRTAPRAKQERLDV